MVDQLLGVTTTAAPAGPTPEPATPPEEPTGPTPTAEAPAAEGESAPETPQPEPSAEPAPEPRPQRPRPAYGARPLEVSAYGGPTYQLTEPPQGTDRLGGRVGVGVGYSFVDWLGVGIRADLLFYMGNADAFGATVGSGIHFAPFRGIPLYIGLRLGLGILQGASGARATFFLLRPEPVVAYRIGRWVQIDLRPATFSLLFGKDIVAQYEALLGMSVIIGT